MSRITDALETLELRKEALIGTSVNAIQSFDVRNVNMMFPTLTDDEIAEIHDLRARFAIVFVQLCYQHQVDAAHALASAWSDGLMLGLIIGTE